MGNIIDVIIKETPGKRFNSYRYCHENYSGNITYDDNKEIKWAQYGETEKFSKPINLKDRADKLIGYPSIFTFFLDGSRHTYKVEDVSYHKNVYPIIAGQIGVGCCERINKKLHPALQFERKLVIVLPDKAFSTDWIDPQNVTTKLLEKINSKSSLNSHTYIPFDEIMLYNTNKDDEFENKGIEKIQDYMCELEKQVVAKLVGADKLDNDHYLIKDGSLDYRAIKPTADNYALNISEAHIKNNYRRVIGVSKSFDPTKCLEKGGGSNSDIIANLKPYERTPAYRYTSTRSNVDLCIWYVRLRDSRYTRSVFEGVIKVEKILVTSSEIENGLDSDDINNITAHLINEHNPVCYGADNRWANHLYPIYLTESYIKSKYISTNTFLNLF